MKNTKLFHNLTKALFPAPLFCLSCEINILHFGEFILCSDCFTLFLESRKTEFLKFITEDELRLQPHLEDTADIVCAFPYNEITQKLIHTYKFSLYKDCAKFWANAISFQVAQQACTIIIPVPSSRKSIEERGFSHMSLLSEELSKITGIPVLDKVLVRNKDVRHQVGLSRQQRLENVKNIFECTQDLSGQSVLLLDDVLTTGATVYHCKLALEKKGASVKIFTLARA